MNPTAPHRPKPAIPDPVNVPGQLRELAQWVAWKYVYVAESKKWTKVPVNARTGRLAHSTGPKTWSTFGEAMGATTGYPDIAGVGFVFTADGPYAGIDLDDCIHEAGVIAPVAKGIIELFRSYTEVSPSGTGVKIFIVGRKPAGSGCRTKNVAGFGEIEIYDHGRYFTVTGQKIQGAPDTVEQRQSELEELCRCYVPPAARAGSKLTLGRGFQGSDQELIKMALSAKNGAKFQRLFNGDTSLYGGDDSAADQAICGQLAFWCGPDPDRIDRIFRTSKLYRDKWERRDYRNATISNAISSCTEFYKHASLTGGSGPTASRAPHIRIDIDEHRVGDEAVNALVADPDLYQRGGSLVRVARDASHNGGVTRPEGSATIARLPSASLRERLTKYCSLVKHSRSGELVATHPPPWLVAAVEARGTWPGIRVLAGISDIPFVRADGSVWQTPGYDSATHVLYEPCGTFPSIKKAPGRRDALAAVNILLEAVCDFTFQAGSHRAAWLSWLLTPFARFAYEGPAPLFLVDANIRGAGKGLLAQIVGEIVLGRPMPVSTYCPDPAEMRKRITAIAMAGDQLVLFDNLEGILGNSALDAALTTISWTDRVLGTNDLVTLPLYTVWSANGNNVQVGADTARRTVYCRLDVLHEHPEERRGFRHPDLVGWVRQNRQGLVAACVTIVAAYLQAKKPAQDLTAMGSYDGWSEVVRGALVWIGQPDPCETRRQMAESSDTSRDVLEQLITAWRQYDPENIGVVVADMVTCVFGINGDRPELDPVRAALKELAGTPVGDTPSARQVGGKLRSYRRRVIDGFYLDHDPSRKKAGGAVWRLYRSEGAHAP